MYSIESMESFENLQYWLSDFKKNADPNAVVILVGNKCDCENIRRVPKETALAFANENAMSFYETSAKESIDVDIAFTNVLKGVYVYMCLSVCVCVCVCVSMCACICTCVSGCVHAIGWVGMCVGVYMCTYTHTYTYTYVNMVIMSVST